MYISIIYLNFYNILISIQEEEISQEKTHNENVENTFEDINGKSKLIRNNARKRICKYDLKETTLSLCFIRFEIFQMSHVSNSWNGARIPNQVVV